MIDIAVMCSGRGSTLEALIDACADGRIDGRIRVVVANKRSAYALERARARGIEAIFVSRKEAGSAEAFDAAVLDILQKRGIGLIIMAGYLAIHGDALVNAYPNRILNIHPSLIPAFCGKGFYGEHVHRAVLEYGAKVSGATVHLVNLETDGGPIVLQQAVPVMDLDTPDTLAARTLPVEHALLIRAAALFCQGRLAVQGRHVHIQQ